MKKQFSLAFLGMFLACSGTGTDTENVFTEDTPSHSHVAVNSENERSSSEFTGNFSSEFAPSSESADSPKSFEVESSSRAQFSSSVVALPGSSPDAVNAAPCSGASMEAMDQAPTLFLTPETVAKAFSRSEPNYGEIVLAGTFQGNPLLLDLLSGEIAKYDAADGTAEVFAPGETFAKDSLIKTRSAYFMEANLLAWSYGGGLYLFDLLTEERFELLALGAPFGLQNLMFADGSMYYTLFEGDTFVGSFKIPLVGGEPVKLSSDLFFNHWVHGVDRKIYATQESGSKGSELFQLDYQGGVLDQKWGEITLESVQSGDNEFLVYESSTGLWKVQQVNIAERVLVYEGYLSFHDYQISKNLIAFTLPSSQLATADLEKGNCIEYTNTNVDAFHYALGTGRVWVQTYDRGLGYFEL